MSDFESDEIRTENEADALDGDVLGEKPGDDDLPGVNAFTDDPHMLNAEDPSLTDDGQVIDDDVISREWREQPDFGEPPRPGPDRDEKGIRLQESDAALDHGVPQIGDEEAEMLGEAFVADNPTAEEAAMHIED